MRNKRLPALTTPAPSTLGMAVFGGQVSAEFERRLEAARQAGYDEGYTDAMVDAGLADAGLSAAH